LTAPNRREKNHNTPQQQQHTLKYTTTTQAVTTEIDSLIYQFSKQSEIFERKQKPKTKAKSAAKAER